MITLSVFLLSIFIIPTIASAVVFKFFFPKHIIKLSDSSLITMGSGLTVFSNLPILYYIFRQVVPDSVMVKASDLYDFILRWLYTIGYGEFLLLFLIVIIIPPIISSFIFYWLNFCLKKYHSDKNNPPPLNFPDCIPYKLGRFISESTLNYMANLTIYDEENEVLLVDILDAEDSLYSGIYTEFFMEDGKFTGISIVNVIRYSFKNEKQRKEVRNQTSASRFSKTTKEKKDTPYILPRLGEMYFPSSQIQNLHFWKIKKGQILEQNVTNEFDESMLVWYIMIQNSFKDLNLKVIAYSKKTKHESWKVFTKCLKKFSLDLSQFELISFSEITKKNNSDTL